MVYLAMRIVCLDLEGVLVPEIWIAFSEASGIPELRLTTRDEPDYDKLMRFRLAILKEKGLKLPDIQKVAAGMDVLSGALDFTQRLRERTQLIILSDTFMEFAQPLMAKLGYPTLFCNSLLAAPDGTITGYQLRQQNGKKHAVEALRSLNMKIFAAGDSFNDLAMIEAAHDGCLFRAPGAIRKEYSRFYCADSYEELFNRIEIFLNHEPVPKLVVL
jgi:phosphoserine/homoserine phosphotransferase